MMTEHRKAMDIDVSFFHTLSDARSLSEIFTKTLEIICKKFAWNMGVYWQRSQQNRKLSLSQIWHDDSPIMQRILSSLRYPEENWDENILGAMWKTGQAYWLSNNDPFLSAVFKSSDPAPNIESVVVPIASPDGAIGILQFFNASPIEHNNETLDTLMNLSDKLSITAHFKRREEELFHHNISLKNEIHSCLIEAQQREKQMRVIADAIPMRIAEFDCNERYRFINSTSLKWTGLPREQIIGKSLTETLGDRYQEVKPHIDKVLSGEIVSFDARHNYNGKEMFLSFTAIPEFGEDGKVIGFISVGEDVTKHKEAKEAAEAANAAKSAFLANMSHEIRTPLGVIIGLSELMCGSRLSNKNKMKYASSIKRNGELLSTIINDILDLSKIEAGKFEADNQRVRLADALTDVSTTLKLQAEEKGLQLVLNIEGRAPKYITTDVLRLRQILFNVVGNAIKFTHRGSVEVNVRYVPLEEGKSKLLFEVKDSGVGIGLEKVTKLFQPFTQADTSTKREFGGTGLGLALSQRLANLLGGDVELSHSEVNKGCTFTITIDPGTGSIDGIQDSVKDLASPPYPSMIETNIRLDGSRILLVEDSPDNQMLIKRYLKVAGATVDTAENGREAVQKAMNANYDLLLMDIQMPIMDGYEATSILRQKGFTKPIVALTAHAFKEERERCLASGFNDHMSKPIIRGLLVQTIAQHIRTALITSIL